MDILKNFAQKAGKLNKTVIFAEGDEERTLEAAARLSKDGICRVILVAQDAKSIERAADKKGLDITRLKILIPSPDKIKKQVLENFVRDMSARSFSGRDIEGLVLDPLYFSALYVRSGFADAYVAGARSDTADLLRAVMYGIGKAADTKLISSFFLMVPPENHNIIKEPIIYADCAVNPDPSAMGLREIGIASIGSFKRLFPGETVKAAFLSFSTKGSAKLPALKKITDAVRAVELHFKSDPNVFIDGELQFDAAVVPSVSQRKAPGSPVGGRANIFIFPDLNSGNICYKATERLGGFKAFGPVLQGTLSPSSDLSRGCSADDIYYAACLTILQSH